MRADSIDVINRVCPLRCLTPLMHSRDTWLLEIPVILSAFTSSSTERVEMPWT